LLEFLFWLFVGPALLASVLALRSGKRYQDFVEGEILGQSDPDLTPFRGPVSLILPVRGADYDLASNLRSLADQDYPDFELIVAARDESDPAVRVARVTLGDRFRLVVAGPPPKDRGEKIHNLLAAVAAARPDSEAFVFADSDGQVAPNWLSDLVSGLSQEEVGAMTAFRWYFPEDGGFWPLLRSAWDSVIAGSLRDDGKNFVWGGGMALRRETFDQAKVAEYWQGAISDDYRVLHALQDSRLEVRFAPRAMVATTGPCSAGEFLDWTIRQMTITKVYRKPLWVAGLVSHIIYCGAMVASLVAGLLGHPIGWGALTIILVVGMAKGAMRGYVGGLMFPQRAEWFEQHGWAYFWLTPVATWVWLYAFLGSAFTRTISWRGYVYELVSKTETRRLASPE